MIAPVVKEQPFSYCSYLKSGERFQASKWTCGAKTWLY